MMTLVISWQRILPQKALISVTSAFSTVVPHPYPALLSMHMASGKSPIFAGNTHPILHGFLSGLVADCVLADPRWPEGVEALFRAARQRGIATVLDGDVADAAVFERLLPLTDHAIFSEPGLRGFGGADVDHALAQAAGFGCRMVAVTRGSSAIVWRDELGRHEMPIPTVPAVDTTAAGDVFHGAYAFAMGMKLGIEEALGFASALAALKCTRHGGRAAIPPSKN